jgi:hypothetical protein
VFGVRQVTTYILRLIWIASQVLALCAGEGSRCRWWCWYLGASLLLSVTYWPELLGSAWYEAFWPLLLAVTLLRTIAALEALHHQTEDFPLWSRMMAGVFLMAIAVVLSVWELRAGTSAQTAVQLRRYLQLWTGAAMVLTWGMLWSVGLLRWRQQDQHSAIVGALCLLHMGVTIAGLHYPNPTMGTMAEKIAYEHFWVLVDRWATAADALIYLTAAQVISGRVGSSQHTPGCTPAAF